MESRLRRIFRAFLVLYVLSVSVESASFPTMEGLEIEFYETEVTVTNLDQKITALATEYYDNSVQRGMVSVLADGNRFTIHYNKDLNQILEINSTTCQVWEIDESQYAYEPLFYGWLSKDPVVIGPSAALWTAQKYRDSIESPREAVIRDIKCEAFSLKIDTKRDNVTITYYFAVEDWTTPYSMKGLRVPIRIEITGLTSQESKNAEDFYPINQITDFAYFRPVISDFLVFQPPIGIGCPLRKSSRTLPTVPKVFTYAAEVYDLRKAEKTEISDVEYHQVWYDSTRYISRLDKYTKMRSTSELYDFNMGVTYSTQNGRTCTIKPLENSFFESYDGHMLGRMKTPAEVLNLDGEFYYMGDRLARGIWTESYESVQNDVIFMDKHLNKLVVTVFYTKENLEVSVTGETETRIPVYYIITGWDTPTHIAIKLQYNIFGFNDMIWPEMYTSFQLGRCYPSMNDKSYFIMIMNVDASIAAKMEALDDMVKAELRIQLTNVAKISDMRIPFLNIDYKRSGVFITGLLLERPPAILQFIEGLELDETSTTDAELKVIPEADTRETCAFACIDESDFICKGFYFCGQACFLKSKDMLEPDDGGDKKNLGSCKTWLRAERESSNKEAYLPAALDMLEKTVSAGKFSIPLKFSDSDVEVVPVSDIVIGDGPYTGDDNQDLPYTEVIKFAKLKSDDETTEVTADVSTMIDCYKACKVSQSTACASFSYCPELDNKQCIISSVLIVDREKNVKDTTADKDCYIYSLKFLDFYTAYPGRVFLISGDKSFNGLKAPEECAKKCREEKDFTCRGFEFCRNTKTCVLHSKHVMDLKHENSTHNPLIKPSVCTHYAAKFAADYYDMGYTLLNDPESQVRTEITLEECALACSEEYKNNCRSFNFCPASDPYATDSSCSISSKALRSRNVSTTTKEKCKHYEKRDFVDDWAKPRPPREITKIEKVVKEEIVNDGNGYTSKSFTGIVIGTLAVGLIVGALGFVGYSYYRSRSSGEGLTVRFMKSDI